MTTGEGLVPHHFASASREDVWILPGGGRQPHLVARRESHGLALTKHDYDGIRIEAFDNPPPTASASQLVKARRAFETDLANQFQALPIAASCLDSAFAVRLKLRGNASIVARGRMETTRTSLFITASVRERGYEASVVTSPRFMKNDIEMLSAAPTTYPRVKVDSRSYPIVWRAGTGAVLMHEAIGHAAEQGAPRLAWPLWLKVADVPDFDGGFLMGGCDDIGESISEADLTAGGRPSARRRASFSDLPIARMTNVVVRQQNAPWTERLPRIEVSLVGGGRYDPLTDGVTIVVVGAELISEGGTQTLAPFEFNASRTEIAERLEGAAGEPFRYPGVICSSEGQELVVGSFSPDVITSPMAS